MANRCVVRRAGAVLALAALLVAGACSDGDDQRVGPTIPLVGSSTTTSTTAALTSTTLGPADYEVPEVIDQAYVQRVVSAYDKVLGDAIRVLKRDGGVSEEFLKHLLAIYTAEEFEFQQKLWAEEAAAGRADVTPVDAGDPETSIKEVHQADVSCITAAVTRDFRPTLNPGSDPVRPKNDHYVVLVRKKPGRDPLALNRTPWVLAFDGSKNDNSVPVNSCGD